MEITSHTKSRVYLAHTTEPSVPFVDLYNLAVKGYLNTANALPAFSIPYFTEIFMARDEEEVNRLISTALKVKIVT